MCEKSSKSESEVNFSFDSLKVNTCGDVKQMTEICFNYFSDSSANGITYQSFVHLLESLFKDSDGQSYHIPLQWKKDLFALFDANKDHLIDFNEFELTWNWIQVILEPKSALIIIDVQNDFITGSLALSRCPSGHNGEDIIPIINNLIDSVPFDKVVYTLDWHPKDHISFFENKDIRKFKAIDEQNNSVNDIKVFDTVIFEGPPQIQQKLWPTHCIEKTWGSQIHSDLKISGNSIQIFKGTKPYIDSYSAFWDNQRLSQTNLNEELKNLNITDVYVCGVATDFCVGYSALDAIDCGYRTVVIEDATRGICPQAIDCIKQTLIDKKAVFVDSSQVLQMVRGVDRRPEIAFAKAFSTQSFKV